ncbi:MupA/Atu3671 family FMN-dependent luciferase-like monooxygenase [Micromonospora sp. NPDC049051]|uniref:MupA/Atu3671 family FMN-dependent luciferase-like monooxygenase n=1 Tax=Micromonospora sp. NPDC049051 TaxID=3364264 RepID=UPI003723E3F4
MDFSLFYFADGDSDSKNRYRLLLDGARFADEHRFAAVWTPERHFHPFGAPYANPAVTGAAVAAVTEHVGVRAGSVVGPLHHPARITEEWSMVDSLSGGRAGIAIASGWSPADFVLRPGAYENRARHVLETVEAVRGLWRGDAVCEIDGRGKAVTVTTYPRPVQPELPMWLTSAGNVETFRAAGRLGVGVLTHLLGQDIDRLRELIQEYRTAFRAHGRSGQGHVALMLHTFLGTDLDQVRETVRAPFSAYLRSNLNLVTKSVAGGKRFDPRTASAADVDFLIGRSFERYFRTAGLFGSVADVLPLVEDLRRIGVDEVASLIDFGVGHDVVLASLPYLVQLRDLIRSRSQDNQPSSSSPATAGSGVRPTAPDLPAVN